MQEFSLFSTPLPAFIVRRVFDEGHSHRCEVIPHCSFDLHFSSFIHFIYNIVASASYEDRTFFFGPETIPGI